MFSLARSLRQRTPQLQTSLQCTRRWLAEVVDATPNTPQPEIPIVVVPHTEPVNWRKEKVPVREDHGLYAFFRRKEPEDGKVFEGEAKFVVCETPQSFQTLSGRGWKAEELRLKSFKDLHTLWYVLVRERNLLATQKEETRRMGVQNPEFQVNGRKLYHVRKSMARIKQVLNERRLAYEKAYDIASAQREVYESEKVLTHLRSERRKRAAEAEATEAAAKAARGAEKKLAAQAQEKAPREVAGEPEPVLAREKTPREVAGEAAAAGLFGGKL